MKAKPSPCSKCIVYTMCLDLCSDAKDYLVQNENVDIYMGVVARRILGYLSDPPWFSFRGESKYIIENK